MRTLKLVFGWMCVIFAASAALSPISPAGDKLPDDPWERAGRYTGKLLVVAVLVGLAYFCFKSPKPKPPGTP